MYLLGTCLISPKCSGECPWTHDEASVSKLATAQLLIAVQECVLSVRACLCMTHSSVFTEQIRARTKGEKGRMAVCHTYKCYTLFWTGFFSGLM